MNMTFRTQKKQPGLLSRLLSKILFEFAQTPDPFFSEANMAYVKKSVKELRAGKGTAHELIEVDDE